MLAQTWVFLTRSIVYTTCSLQVQQVREVAITNIQKSSNLFGGSFGKCCLDLKKACGSYYELPFQEAKGLLVRGPLKAPLTGDDSGLTRLAVRGALTDSSPIINEWAERLVVTDQ